MNAEEQEEKEQLLEEVYFYNLLTQFETHVLYLCSDESFLIQGFSTWSRRDFNAFIRACEKYGRNDIKAIAFEMEGKSEEEVERYAKVFKQRYRELNGKQ